MPLGTLEWGYWFLKDASMAIFWVSGFIGLCWLVFGGLWGPLGCLGCLWTAIGALFVTSGAPLGRLWRIIGLHWDAFGRHWGSILRGHLFIVWNFRVQKTVLKFSGFVFKEKNAKRPNCELDICWSKWRPLKKKNIVPKKRHRFRFHICWSKGTPKYSFTRLVSRNPNFYNTNSSQTNQS